MLAILVGPLVVLLLQLSLRRGTLAAFAAAFGIWFSDACFILGSYYGADQLEEITEHAAFYPLVGSVGGVILLVTAVVMWLRNPPDLNLERTALRKRSVFAAFLQGFAVNTFNPFTITFWAFFTLTQVKQRGLTEAEAWAIFGGLMSVIVLSDSIKVLAARKIRELLKPRVILWLQRVGALALAVFGVVLGVRAWLTV
ncbi:MAG: LysE family transporter [Bacteroidota bacterium]